LYLQSHSSFICNANWLLGHGIKQDLLPEVQRLIPPQAIAQDTIRLINDIMRLDLLKVRISAPFALAYQALVKWFLQLAQGLF
jgi:hypothetical protein